MNPKNYIFGSYEEQTSFYVGAENNRERRVAKYFVFRIVNKSFFDFNGHEPTSCDMVKDNDMTDYNQINKLLKDNFGYYTLTAHRVSCIETQPEQYFPEMTQVQQRDYIHNKLLELGFIFSNEYQEQLEEWFS